MRLPHAIQRNRKRLGYGMLVVAAAAWLQASGLDTAIDLYGKTVLVEFIDRIRNEQRFTSVDALVSQIEADVEVARLILS